MRLCNYDTLKKSEEVSFLRRVNFLLFIASFIFFFRINKHNMARDTFPQLPKNLKGNFVVSNTSYADRISAFKSYFTEVREYSISESKCSEFSKAKHCTCQVADLLSDEGNLATVAHIAESIMSLKFTNEEGYVAYINSENRPFKTDTFNVRHFVPQAPDGSDIPRHSFDHIICRGSWAKLMQVTTRIKWNEIVRHSDITGSSYRQDIDSLVRYLSTEFELELEPAMAMTTLTQDDEETEKLLIMVEATVQLDDL